MPFAGGPIYGVSIIPERPTSDGLGNLTWAFLPQIDNAVFALTAPTGNPTTESTFSQIGQLFVPRGSDLLNGDRVPYFGRYFAVIGEPMWDFNHPFTNDDFGYLEVQIAWGTRGHGR